MERENLDGPRFNLFRDTDWGQDSVGNMSHAKAGLSIFSTGVDEKQNKTKISQNSTHC